MELTSPDLLAAVDQFRGRAQQYDITGNWPASDLQALEKLGAMRWIIPTEFGGDELPPLDHHLLYETIANGSLSTALILTQRDSAVALIAGGNESPARDELMQQLAEPDFFTTVGIAQLTTSRQSGAPALIAERTSNGYRLNGAIPWCTGARNANVIVAGAATSDGQQILFALDPQSSGVTVAEPMNLVALRSTFTSSITLQNVELEDRWLLRSPSNAALGNRRGGLTLGQTFLAMGLCRSALDLIAQHTSDRARAIHHRFELQLIEIRQEILALSQPGNETEASTANARLRGACNELAIRITHAAVALYKGTALLADHPAQRLAREAMFLLVWSCPNPVIDCTVDLLSASATR